MESEPSASPRRANLVTSVEHALTLLASLRDHPSLAVRESAELLGVAPSTAHRLLTTMQASGFVVQDPTTRRYGPGPTLLHVALSALRRIDVGRVARPHLSALAAETRETVNLAVGEGAVVRFIDSVEGSETVRVSARTGVVVPAHSTAAGKAFLAGLGKEELRRLYPSAKLQRRTPHTVVTRAKLDKELEQVRRAGYATSHGESSPDLGAVAVGIHDVRGRVIAALAVSVPVERLDERHTARIAALLRRHARQVEEELGAG